MKLFYGCGWEIGLKRINCEIPYRCILPKNIEGLLIACRSASMTADHIMDFVCKMIYNVLEKAGIAAALSIKSKKKHLVS